MATVAAGTGLTPKQLARNALHRRAIEAVIWGMPAVNTDLMYQAMAREVKGGWNQIVDGHGCSIGRTRHSRLPDIEKA